jgi:hypothetical protein
LNSAEQNRTAGTEGRCLLANGWPWLALWIALTLILRLLDRLDDIAHRSA